MRLPTNAFSNGKTSLFYTCYTLYYLPPKIFKNEKKHKKKLKFCRNCFEKNIFKTLRFDNQARYARNFKPDFTYFFLRKYNVTMCVPDSFMRVGFQGQKPRVVCTLTEVFNRQTLSYKKCLNFEKLSKKPIFLF